MEKTITINKKKIKLSNNVLWLKIYKQQFMHDITPDLIPILTSAITLTEGIVTREDGAKDINSDALVDAIYQLAGFEITTLMNVAWAMAKCADDSIDGPDEWISQIGEFPLDEVGPVIIELAGKGLVSSKNLKRLQELVDLLRSSTSTQSTSQE